MARERQELLEIIADMAKDLCELRDEVRGLKRDVRFWTDAYMRLDKERNAPAAAEPAALGEDGQVLADGKV